MGKIVKEASPLALLSVSTHLLSLPYIAVRKEVRGRGGKGERGGGGEGEEEEKKGSKAPGGKPWGVFFHLTLKILCKTFIYLSLIHI